MLKQKKIADQNSERFVCSHPSRGSHVDIFLYIMDGGLDSDGDEQSRRCLLIACVRNQLSTSFFVSLFTMFVFFLIFVLFECRPFCHSVP